MKQIFGAYLVPASFMSVSSRFHPEDGASMFLKFTVDFHLASWHYVSEYRNTQVIKSFGSVIGD
jgi:hypothetical protein